MSDPYPRKESLKLEFLGVGEAYHPQLGNTSYLIHSKSFVLIDCGYAVPRYLFQRAYAPDMIDAIYLTHFHADHYFGLPPLLNYWREDKRTKPFAILGQVGTEKKISNILEMAYPGMQAKLGFDLIFQECREEFSFDELELSFAETRHSVLNVAIKIAREGHRIGISGDGALTPDSKKLFENCNVLVHEAFTLNEPRQGHTTAKEVIKYANTLPELKTLALVHLHRDARNHQLKEFMQLEHASNFELIIPNPGDILSLE